MTINDLLMRFGPVYAADTGGAPAPAAGNEQIQSGSIGGVPSVAEAEEGDDPAAGEGDDVDAGLDLGLDPAQPAEGEEPEWEEIEHDDLKLRVPKGLSQKAKDALMLRADHTRKTQELAEQRAKVEAREKLAQTRTEYDDKISEGVFHLKQMDSALKTEYAFFQSPAYRQLQQDDFVAAQARWNDYQMNLQTRSQLAGGLQALAHERDSKVALAADAEKQEANKRREQLPREIAKLVPGWNDQRHAAVKDFAIGIGFAPEALAETTDPLHFQVLHLAEIGKRYLDARARQGKGGVIPKPAQPTRKVAPRSGGGSRDPEKMSADEYRANYLREQAAKNGQRRA